VQHNEFFQKSAEISTNSKISGYNRIYTN